jgi:uncharacterized protein (UPF0147 family)
MAERFDGTEETLEQLEALIGKENALKVCKLFEGENVYFPKRIGRAESQFKDSGITEENVRNIRKARKEAKKHLDKYKEAIDLLGKDRPAMLEELRENKKTAAGGITWDADSPAASSLEIRKVAGGVPLAPAPAKRRLLLPTDPGVELLYAEG